MTIAEWRKDKQLVLRARKVIEMPEFKEMIAVLREDSPVNYPLPATGGVTSDDRSAQLGRIEGAAFAIRALLSLGNHQPPTKEPKQSYA